jgi:hypothetical protein
LFESCKQCLFERAAIDLLVDSPAASGLSRVEMLANYVTKKFASGTCTRTDPQTGRACMTLISKLHLEGTSLMASIASAVIGAAARAPERKEEANAVSAADADDYEYRTTKIKRPAKRKKSEPQAAPPPPKFRVQYQLAKRMLPRRVRELLEQVPEDDYMALLGLDAPRPSLWPVHYVLRSIPVLPPCSRPWVLMNGQKADDDLTFKYAEIIRSNNMLGDGTARSVADREANLEALEFHVSTLYNNTAGRARHPNNRALKSIKERINGKKGLVRNNLNGKRSDMTGRTVIGPDPNLEIDELGLPQAFADRLTFPEKVTVGNMASLQRLVDGGRGANYVIQQHTASKTDPQGPADCLNPAANVTTREVRRNLEYYLRRMRGGQTAGPDIDEADARLCAVGVRSQLGEHEAVARVVGADGPVAVSGDDLLPVCREGDGLYTVEVVLVVGRGADAKGMAPRPEERHPDAREVPDRNVARFVAGGSVPTVGRQGDAADFFQGGGLYMVAVGQGQQDALVRSGSDESAGDAEARGAVVRNVDFRRCTERAPQTVYFGLKGGHTLALRRRWLRLRYRYRHRHRLQCIWTGHHL